MQVILYIYTLSHLIFTLYVYKYILIKAWEGRENLVQLCLNLGADPNLKDGKNGEGRTPKELAQETNEHHVVQLLTFTADMKANIGQRVQDIAKHINIQKGIIENVINELNEYDENKQNIFKTMMIDIMIKCIKKRLVFSDDNLLLVWRFVMDENEKNGEDPLKSKLWQAIESTCNDIINNGSKRDWHWLKTYLIPSDVKFIVHWYNLLLFHVL